MNDAELKRQRPRRINLAAALGMTIPPFEVFGLQGAGDFVIGLQVVGGRYLSRSAAADPYPARSPIHLSDGSVDALIVQAALTCSPSGGVGYLVYAGIDAEFCEPR